MKFPSMEKKPKRGIMRGLNGETENERQEIKQRQFAVRASWDSDTEFRRRERFDLPAIPSKSQAFRLISA